MCRPLLHIASAARCFVGAAVLVAASSLPAQSSPPPSGDAAGLPLKTITASGAALPVFALFITGDGGWASIDNDITAELAEHGVNVVGLDSRAYLHERRTPDQVAADVARIVRQFQEQWHQEHFILVGYSRGADLAPFIASRLDTSLRADLSLVAMIGLGERAGFEFHFQDIFRDVKRAGDLPTLPELEKLRGVPMMCIYGTEEKASGCRDAPPDVVERVARNGSHHFDNDYRAIADLILADLRNRHGPGAR
jgi:type IV secretory pathway VirJ component